MKGFVLSDLHLFADRSNAEFYAEQIVEISHQADFIVLNGDIFDFKWSRFPSTADTIKGALNWLDQLVSRNQSCTIHYVMGNHDGLISFGEALKGFTKPNFQWHPTHVRIGSALFVHGDLPLAGKNPFVRELIEDERAPHNRMHALYTHAVRFRLHRAADMLYYKTRSVKLLYTALQRFPHADLDGVTDIYFGHTHVCFEGFKYREYTFHNTGGAIRGVNKKILAVG